MADPVTLGLLAASAAVTAGGQIMGGNAEGAAKAYQAQVARINAGVARKNRDQTLQAGQDKALNYGTNARQQMGKLITAQSGSGLDITAGTSAELREGQGAAASRDIATIYDNTARQAYGFEVKAANDEASSSMLEAGGKAAKRAGNMKAIGTLISAAGSVSGKWSQGKQMGMWGDDTNEVDVGSATEWWKENA